MEFICVYWAVFVYGFADDVQDMAQRCVVYGYYDGCVGIGHFLSPHETLGRVYRDGVHGVLVEMLRNFQNQLLVVVVGFQRVQDRWQMLVKLYVDDGADYLGHFVFCVRHVQFLVWLERFCV